MRELHRGVFTGSAPRPALRVPGMTAQVRAAIARRTPALARRVPADPDPSLMSIGGNARERALLDVASRADGPTRLAPVVLVLGLLGLLLVALRAPDRRRGAWASGLALAGAGGALVAGWTGARTLTLEGFDTSWGDAVVKTIWGAYLGDLRAWSLGLAGAGILVAAVAARPEHRTRLSWSRIRAPVRGVGAAPGRRDRAGRPRPRVRPRDGGDRRRAALPRRPPPARGPRAACPRGRRRARADRRRGRASPNGPRGGRAATPPARQGRRAGAAGRGSAGG